MTRQFVRPAMRLAAILALALGVSACQTVDDTVSALDPTGLFSSDDTAPLPADTPPTAASDSDVTTPSLAAIPARPAAPSASQQAQAAQQVASAGAQAQYSAQALRAGTEAAAPPPPPVSGTVAPPTATAAPVTQAALAPPTANAPPTAGSDLNAPPTAEAQPMEQADLNVPPTATPPSAAPSASPATPPAVVASAAPEPAPALTPATAPPPGAQPPASMAAPAAAPASNTLAPPPGAEPAVPAVPPNGSGVQLAANPTSAQLGFHASSAPPLNAEVAQWVPAPILSHFRRTAAVAGVAGASTGAPDTPAGMIAAMNGGVAPNEIIYFTDNTASLSAKARNQISAAVAAFKVRGANASVRVVGHASSRTANMSLAQHNDVVFRMSQERANAVAQALIRAGVPASRVQIEAVGDSQPIYYESMPKGEAGNRRAEIFITG